MSTTAAGLEQQAAEILGAGTFVALTGAGLSTDSGIPDHRSPGAPVRTPMTATEFRSGAAARSRYWARSYLGWQVMDRAVPNAGHRALAALERSGRCIRTITQNVDGLHGLAGSRRVIDLHGRVDQVRCLTCEQVTDREVLQRRMAAANPGFGSQVDLTVNPDGDVDSDAVGLATDSFVVPACLRCTGILKPRVVFFGDSVPKPVVQECFSAVDAADALLVAGSSLTVMSGLRFVRHAHRLGRPVVIVNRGVTRGDEFATLKIDLGCSPVLSALAAALPAGSGPGQTVPSTSSTGEEQR